jgi:hypothetical protein
VTKESAFNVIAAELAFKAKSEHENKDDERLIFRTTKH